VALLLVLFLVLAGGGAWVAFTESGQKALSSLLQRGEGWIPGGQRGAVAYTVSNPIGYYEGAAAAGRLFVIKGQVTNASLTAKHGIRVTAALLDGRGAELARQTVFAGNSLSGDFLRRASREEIAAQMASPVGGNLQNLGVAPGKAIPFTVVFFDAPEGVEAYRLEATD